MIETAKVPQRRKIHFSNYEQVLDEARRLAGKPTRQLGNWSLGQICRHLAIAMEQSISGDRLFKVPLKRRILGRLYRWSVLHRGFPPGIKLPRDAAALIPPPTSVEEGLAALEKGIESLHASSHRVAHPVLGKMNVRQWDKLHLRHAEMHLSFIEPE
jgi:hypothetical protein